MNFELNSCAKDLIDALGDSPVELTKNYITKIKSLFPIPREQELIWADVEFDLRPSGIVCTDKGVFIKTNVSAIPKKVKNADGKKEKEKAQLFYFKWEDFEPGWFTSSVVEENRALLVETQCSEKFINGCKTLSANISEVDFYDYNMLEENEIEELLAQVVPIDVAALHSSQSAVFVEHKAATNTTSGHGEMAEEAITLIDKALGYDAVVIGRDNAKDGADRIVDGIFIQTKYYNTATGSCEACFSSENGMYRYMQDGKPMQLEVPKDQYEAVLNRFEMKIKQGKVPGVTDPADARKIVRKGRLTYKQAVNLTKPGKIESLAYDAATGAVMCSCAFGITFVATVFLTWQRTGDIKEAVKTGVSAGIQVFGISFVQHMVVSQIARTGLASTLMAPSQQIVQRLGSQASATIVNGIRALSGKSAIYGAAASKHLAKILRSNVRLTYKQAVNLTKPGKIESLAYDAATGAVMCSCAFGITFVATVFLTWQRTGDIKEAVKTGVSAGIQVFGISFVQHMVVSQIARTGLASTLMAPSQQIVQRLGSQASATIVNGIRALSGKSAIYGAAASKHLAKILRSNVITSALTFAIFSIPETYKVASKKISVAQYTKNISVLLGSILGGAGGAVAAGVVAAKVAGAAGTAVAPGVGTAIGIVGGFVGGVVSSKAVDVVGDIFHEDDTEIIGRFFNAIVSCLIGEYLLDSSEMDRLIENLDSIPQKEFKTLFSAILKEENQEDLVRNFLIPHFDVVIEEREFFTLPSGETILEAMVEDCIEEK